MNKRNTLFQAKRILAMFLAVAMVVTMLPTTSYAANDGGDVTMQEVTTAAEGSNDGGDEADLATSVSIELEEESLTREYTGDVVFDSIETLKNFVKVTVNEEEVTVTPTDITLTWNSVGTDGALKALAQDEVPVNAGAYNLSVELKARKGLYSAAKMEGGVNFTITPTTVTVVPEMTAVVPGTKVSDIAVTKVTAVANNGKVFPFILDDEATTDINEADKSQVAVAVSVRDAFSGAVLGTDAILTKEGDYVFDFTATFTEKGKEVAAGNYVMKEVASQDVVISALIPALVDVTLSDAWVGAGKITHVYTGKEISAPAKDTDYTAKVVYDSGEVDEEGNVIYTEITDAQLTEGWYSLQKTTVYEDAEGNADITWEWKETTAPTEAGTYLYRLSYAGVEGIYAEAYADITVVIEPMAVVIKPEVDSAAKFYSQMTEEDVIAQVDYKVFDTEDKEVDVDRTTAWGVSYYNTNRTQSYEPVFVLQKQVVDEEGNAVKDSNDNLVWADNDGEELDAKSKYRVMFSGNKAVYSESRKYTTTYPINYIVNSVEMNYVVDTDYMNALAKNAVEITVMEGTETVIDISKITEGLGGKGDSLENVYTEVYSGANLYDTRADYKKAIVKAGDKQVASDTDDTLTYTWYKNTNDSITDYMFSDRTNEPYTEEEVNEFNNPENWMGVVYIPWEAGVYKLHISYDDTENDEYLRAEADVYYVIEKQKIKAVFTGEFSAYTGYTKDDFMYYTGQNPSGKVSVNMVTADGEVPLDWTYGYGDEYDYYLSFNIEKTTLVEKTDESGAVVKDANGNPVMIPQTTEVWHDCTVSGNEYQVVDAEGNPITEEVTRNMSYNDVFEENAIYRLVPTITNYDTENYTNWEYVIEDVTFITNEAEKKTETHKVRSIEYLNDKADINVSKMGETELKVLVDETKLGSLEKVYDGKSFDLNALLGDAIKLVDKADETKEITDVTLDYNYYGRYWNEYSERFITGYRSSAVDAGEYTLYASYIGDGTYAALSDTEIATVKITPAAITVTPVLPEDVVAGMTVSDLYNDPTIQSMLAVEGAASRDEYAFTNYAGYFEAWETSYVWFDVLDEERNVLQYNEILRGDRTYTIVVNQALVDPYANNYEPEYKETTFTTVRGNSAVFSTYNYLRYQYYTNELNTEYGSAEIDVTVDGMTQTIVPIEAVPYSYELFSGEENQGNFVELQINVPAEYDYAIPDTAMFENSIKDAGGYVANDGNSLYVVFDASAKDKKEFDIRWEDGYVEHFVLDFTNAELMEDLAQAVAPKSIKFNGVTTKMAVGEVQALDIKLTKAQKNDVICIAYKVDNGDVLSVDDQGNATALKLGKATVTAYPVQVINGEKVAIAGAKTAKATITVKAVTAPKIKKVIPQDDVFELQYARVNDGYRREIYVLEGKNVKANVFEEKIASMKDGQWQDIFAVAPIFYSSSEEDSHPLWVNNKWDYNTVATVLTGLNPTTPYTVYVRNVSAIRELTDGSQVTLSASGTVKSFTTTKVQLDGIAAGLEGATYVEYDEYGNYVDYYIVKLVGGKANVTAAGYYPEKASNQAADEGDYIRLNLPLDKAQQATYLNPKLTYTVYDYVSNDGDWGISKIATVNKKGKLTLKGTGWVWIRVYDANTGVYDEIELYIEANANKVKGNKVKLGVGESIALEDMLTYYEGNKKLTGDIGGYIDVDEKLIETFANNEYFELDVDTHLVTAVKAGGKLQVSLTDYWVQKAGGAATATATLTSQALDPVKNLKILSTKNFDTNFAPLTHNYAYLQFTYDEESGADSFLVEVKDGRGRIIRSVNYDRDMVNTAVGADEKEYYWFSIGGLTQQSKYTVTVTAMYNDIEAKEAKATVKTTKIPATNERVYNDDMNSGLDIVVTSEEGWDHITDGKYFISGNTYSLYAFPYYTEAESTASDSLIWSSNNKKVATIKANPGGFYATFKALKVGTTVIEAKSKVTKEVVARYEVNVASVGDAYAIGRRFYEDNKPDEYDEQNPVTEDDLTDGNMSLTIDGYSEEWVSYTAPKDGIYTFSISGATAELYKIIGAEPYASGTRVKVPLKAREEVSLKLMNTYSYDRNVYVTVSSAECLTVTTDKGATVKDAYYTWLCFEAPEDGIYKFTTDTDIAYSSYWYAYENINASQTQYVYASEQRPELFYEMKKGQEVYLYVYSDSDGYDTFEVIVDKYEAVQLAEGTDQVITVEKGKKQWVEFTAKETNYYTFTVALPEDTTDVSNKMTIYDKIGGTSIDTQSSNGSDLTLGLAIKAGEKVAICLEGTSSSYKFGGTLKVTKLPRVAVGTDAVLTKEAYPNGDAWLVFEAPEDGIYAFEPAGDTVLSSSNIRLYSEYNNGYLTQDSNNNGKCFTLYELKAGEVVYVYASASWAGEEASWAVKASKYTMPELAVTTDTEVKADAGVKKWYKFTAPATDDYFFTVTEKEGVDNASQLIRLYEEIGGEPVTSGSTNQGSVSVAYSMNAGTTIYICITANSTIHVVDTVLRADKISEMKLDTDVTISGTANASVGKWLKFTAPKDGFYAFAPTDATVLSTSEIRLYNKINGTRLTLNENRYGKCKAIYEMTADQTVYVWVEATWTGEETSYAVKVSAYAPVVLQKDTPVSVKLGAGEYEWYKFTSPETDTYYFGTVKTEGAENVSSFISLFDGNMSNHITSDGSQADTHVVSYEVNAGETMYVCLEGVNDNEGVDATFTVKGVSELTMEAPYVLNGVSGTTVFGWMKFTAPKAGMYAFETTDDTVLSSSSIGLYDKVDGSSIQYESNTLGGNSKVVYEMTAGQKIYIKASGRWIGEETSYAVRVREYAPTELTIGTAVETKIGGGEYEWYKFTAPTTGIYIFNATNTTSGSGYLYRYTSMNNSYEDDYDYLSSEADLVCDMETGDVVYLKLESNSNTELDGTLRVTTPTVMTLDEAITVPGTTNTTVNTWFKFTATEAGMYAFEPTETTVLSNNTIELHSRENGSWNTLAYKTNSYGRSKVVYEMEAGETVYAEVSAYWSGEETSYQMKVSKFVPVALSVGTDVTVKKGLGEYEMFAFTATEKNTYTFKTTQAESASAYVRIEIFDETGETLLKSNSSTSNELECSCEIDAGEMVYVFVMDYWGDGLDVTLNVSKCTIVTAGTDVVADMPANTENWYLFTATEDGFYSFTTRSTDAENPSGSEVLVYEEKGAGSTMAYGYSSDGATAADARCFVAAGQEVYVRVKPYDSSDAANVTFKIEKCDVTDLSAGSVEAILAAEGSAYYSYPITESGVYRISNAQNAALDANAAYIYAYSNSNPTERMISLSGVNETVVLLKAGEVIYFDVEAYNAVATYVLSITKEAVAELTESTDIGVLAESDSVWISFTATETAKYRFATTQTEGDTYNRNYLYLYTDDTYENRYVQYAYETSYPDSQMAYSITLEAGDEIFWRVDNSNDTSLSLGVDKMYYRKTYVSLEQGEEDMISFTAPSDGTYRFYSTCEGLDEVKDMYGTLYDAEGNVIKNNDDGASEYRQFLIEYTLNAGDLVILGVRQFSRNEAECYAIIEQIY